MYENEFRILVREHSDATPEVERLEGLFEQTLWSVGEATMILAGIHPESTGKCSDSHGNRYHYATLPGVKEKLSCQRTDSSDFHQNIQGSLNYLNGFIMGESQSPSYWVNKAQEKDFGIPWLETAIKLGLLPKSETRAEKEVAQRRSGGLSTQRGSPQGTFKLQVLIEWDRRFAHRRAEGKSYLKKDITQFVREFEERYLSEGKGVGARTIGTWVHDLMRDLFDERRIDWIDRYRTDSEYGKLKMQSAELAAS